MGSLPAPGEVVGKYRIVGVLGEGGMGVVYEAVHERLKQAVAIKMLRPFVAALAEHRARFEREARAAGQLQGPHVARVLDIVTTSSGLPGLVMERLSGTDLAVEVKQRGRLPVAEAVTYVLQACAAMDEAHGLGIVHRDLKPSNIFLAESAAGRVVKVLDFGISKIEEEETRVTEGGQASMGSPLYMSPEQVRNAHEVDPRTDVWSLGVILYELLAGRPPFAGSLATAAAQVLVDTPPPLSLVRDDVPAGLGAAIAKALVKDASARLGDVRALAVLLAPFAPRAASAWLGAPPSSRRLALAVSATPPSLESLRSVPVPPLPAAAAGPTLGASMGTTESWTTGHRSSFLPAAVRLPRSIALFGGAIAIAAMLLAAWLGMRGDGPHGSAAAVAPPPAAVDLVPTPPAAEPLNAVSGVPSASASAGAAGAKQDH